MSEPGAFDGRLLQGAVKALGPTAMVTAWLYYIGWVRTNRQASYFGVDPSLLGYSTTDYVLRSVTSLYGPAGALLIGLTLMGVVRRWLDDRLDAQPERRDHYRGIGRWTALVGVLLALVGAGLVSKVDSGGYWPLWSALTLLPGGLLLLLGRYMSSFGLKSQSTPAGGRHRIDGVEALVIGLILVVGLFTGGFFYAIQVGKASAINLQNRLPNQPEIHLLSATELHLGGATPCEPVRSADSAYRCRYRGLRLLVASNDRLFLVPARWGEPANSYVHIVPETEDIRIDVLTSN